VPERFVRLLVLAFCAQFGVRRGDGGAAVVVSSGTCPGSRASSTLGPPKLIPGRSNASWPAHGLAPRARLQNGGCRGANARSVHIATARVAMLIPILPAAARV
jgi:hypothetical protein